MPQSIMVVHAGLSGAFYKTVPRIPSSGTCNHQGMPLPALRPHLVAKGQQLLAIHMVAPKAPENYFFHSPCPFCPLCTPTLSLNPTLTLMPTPTALSATHPKETLRSGSALVPAMRGPERSSCIKCMLVLTHSLYFLLNCPLS